MNAGLLFPRSNVHPLIGSSFLEGLKAYTKKEGLEKEINFYSESIGFGGAEKEVYAKAEKLLMIDDVDVLIGFIDEKILELIKPLILASGKLFVLVNTGANHPLNWVPQPNIVTLSLQNAFLCAVNGFAAAISNKGEKGVPAAVASTFYDCGYLHLAAMIKEFQLSGGSVQYNYINKQLPADEFNIAELAEFLEQRTDVRTLLCVFDSLPASMFYHTLNKTGGAENLRLFVSPMMLEQKALEKQGGGFRFHALGYLPWHISAPGPGNKEFTEYYDRQLKKVPGLFSVLGWETGMVLKEIFQQSNFREGDAMAEILKAKQFTGPRGNMQLDSITQHFILPAIHCSLEAGQPGMKMEYDVKLDNEWEEFTGRQTEGHVSGWTNTYLCY